MALIATLTAHEAYARILREFRKAKQSAQVRAAELAAGDTSAKVLVNINEAFSNHSTNIAALVATPGLAAYARGQINDDTYDVVTECQTARAALDSVPVWLQANLPTHAGRPDLLEWNAGRLGWRSFTPAQTAPLLPLLNAVDAAISV